MKKTSSMSKDSSNLSKPCFGCDLSCSLVNSLIIKPNFFFGTYGLYMTCEKVEEVLSLIWNI